MMVREIVEKRRLLAQTGAGVRCGDALEVLRTLPGNYFDSCLTDPPYGLEFIGVAWDSFNRPKGKGRTENVWSDFGTKEHARTAGERGRINRNKAIAYYEFSIAWARELYRVLKLGAMLLAFGGTRTHHRLMCAIEDAGFEIRDCLMFLHSQGFPKGLDIGKALGGRAGVAGEDAAKLWDGYNVALKPAWEPVVLAMKPCDGTFAENAIKWGVAGLNIAGCRIPSLGGKSRVGEPSQDRRCTERGGTGFAALPGPRGGDPGGRWPANLLLDEEVGMELDRRTGMLASGRMRAGTRRANREGWAGPMPPRTGAETIGDSGGASRYFYCAKSSRTERGDSTHPTMKPLKLCEYLARLLLPPQRDTPRRLLVPFSGSGSEMIGALRAGWERVVGIDNNAEYCELARRRIRDAMPGGIPAPASPPPG